MDTNELWWTVKWFCYLCIEPIFLFYAKINQINSLDSIFTNFKFNGHSWNWRNPFLCTVTLAGLCLYCWTWNHFLMMKIGISISFYLSLSSAAPSVRHTVWREDHIAEFLLLRPVGAWQRCGCLPKPGKPLHLVQHWQPRDRHHVPRQGELLFSL